MRSNAAAAKGCEIAAAASRAGARRAQVLVSKSKSLVYASGHATKYTRARGAHRSAARPRDPAEAGEGLDRGAAARAKRRGGKEDDRAPRRVEPREVRRRRPHADPRNLPAVRIHGPRGARRDLRQGGASVEHASPPSPQPVARPRTRARLGLP